MKLLGLRKARWGISMTEYLIIMGIVAIAAILIVGLYGKQIKAAFASSTGAIAGSSMANADESNSSAVKADEMGTFAGTGQSTPSGSAASSGSSGSATSGSAASSESFGSSTPSGSAGSAGSAGPSGSSASSELSTPSGSAMPSASSASSGLTRPSGSSASFGSAPPSGLSTPSENAGGGYSAHSLSWLWLIVVLLIIGLAVYCLACYTTLKHRK